MQKRHVTWAKWAAGFAFFAAADTALGTGAVQALAELCLTNPEDDMAAMAPGMPMEHGKHAMLWLIGGGALASFAGFGSWMIAHRAARAPWSPQRRPLLAGLAAITEATGRLRAADLAEAWNDQLDPSITEDDAKIALARFGSASPATRRALMAGLIDAGDRAAFICVAVQLLRRRGDPHRAGLTMLERLAGDMGMSGTEIMEHWDAAHAPSRTAVAIGEARALGAVALRRVLSRAWQATTGLRRPLRQAAVTAGPVLARGARAALWAFVKALSSPRTVRRDDQLDGLRRRFRRRGLSARLQTFATPPRAALRRGLS